MTTRAPLRPAAHGWFMLAPALAVYLLFAVYPMFDVVVMSFSRWNGLAPNSEFAGLENYRWILNDDPVFWGALWNTVAWTLMAVTIPNLIAFGLALALNQNMPATAPLRVIFTCRTSSPPSPSRRSGNGCTTRSLACSTAC